MKHKLLPLDELKPGTIRAVTVNGIALVLIHTSDGRIHAMRDICPHAGARLSRGLLLQPVLESEDGRYTLSDQFVLRCPWHCYEYDLDTGRSLAEPQRVRVRVYDVMVEDGMIFVER